MYIFLVQRTDKVGYDEYDSFICVANSESQARLMNPNYNEIENNLYFNFDYPYISDWVKNPNSLVVTKIGKADSNQPRVILSSYNAG